MALFEKMGAVRDGRRGDLVIEVRVAAKLLDERLKELLREFGKINGESVRDGFFTSGGSAEDRPALRR